MWPEMFENLRRELVAIGVFLLIAGIALGLFLGWLIPWIASHLTIGWQ